MKLATTLQALAGGTIVNVIVLACTSSRPEPTATADAALPHEADVATITCVDGRAARAYPGRTATELAGVQTLGRLTPPFIVNGRNFTHWQTATYTYVRDGEVVVTCVSVDEVTFILR